MDRRIKLSFLLLVILQGFHSIEEYFGELWKVFPPAEFLCTLVADNPGTGFILINSGLFVFGLWSWLFPVRNNYPYARGIIWFWIILELINGIGHPVWALVERGYVPGVVTAIFLFILSFYLCRKLSVTGKNS